MIAALRAPDAAKRYKVSIGEEVHNGFLFMSQSPPHRAMMRATD